MKNLYYNVRKNTVLITVILLVCFISLGYSILQASLNITGSSMINSSSWNVFFDNIKVVPGSINANSPAAISLDKKSVSFNLTFNKPGDFYEFTVDVKNTGTIDAMINLINKSSLTSSQSKFLEYNVTYKDGVELDMNHILYSNESDTYKIIVKFKDNINASDLPSNIDNVSLSFGVEYIQNNEDGYDRDRVEYKYNSSYYSEEDDNTLFDTYNEAISNFGFPFFIKYGFFENELRSASIGFVYNNNVYYLRGEEGRVPYQINKSTLISAFGSENCSTNNYGRFVCNKDSFEMSITNDGYLTVSNDNNWHGCQGSSGSYWCGDFS